MALLEASGIGKNFGDTHVLKDISLTLEQGEALAIIGSSGSGKTTLLRCLNFLERPDTGVIKVNGETMWDAADPATQRESEVRKKRLHFGLVFQNFNLFPQYTALQNVMLAGELLAKERPDYKARKKAIHAELEQQAKELLAQMGLSERAGHYPHQLSGGQQQRVAIARTLAPEPSVLFMDEPLSNLDAKLRLEMRYELQRLHVETGSTFVYVTHDQMEAMTLATQICLINNGVLQQYQAPLEVYHHPANLFVADFVGTPSINFVDAKGKQSSDGSLELTVLGGIKATFKPAKALDMQAWFASRDKEAADKAAALKQKASEKSYVEKGNKDEVFRYHIAKVNEEDDSLQDVPEITNEDFVLGIRPEFLDIADTGALQGEIYGAMPTGMESTVKVRVGEFLLTGVIFGSSLFTIGTKVPLSVTGNQIMLFDRRSGKCITSGSLEF